jgi:hypothetical protein
MRSGLDAPIVVFGKVVGATPTVGCRPSVGSSGTIFCHHPAQPIYVPQGDVCLSRRRRDAGVVESVEDGDPQICTCGATFMEVDERIELELETVRLEMFELDRRSRRRHDIMIVLRDLQQNRPDLAWVVNRGALSDSEQPV